MIKRLPPLLGLSLCLLLTNCAMDLERFALTDANESQIKHLDKQILVSQKTLQPEYDQPIALVGIDPVSLSAALIVDGIMYATVSYTNSQKDKLIQPLIQLTENDEFIKELQRSLDKTLERKQPFKQAGKGIKVLSSNSKDFKAFELERSKANDGRAFLTIPVQYQLNKNMDAFKVFIQPEIQLKKDANINTIYRNKFTYVQYLPHPEKNKEGNIKLWAANKGQLIHQAFRKAAAALAQPLIQDLRPLDNNSVRANNKYSVKTSTETLNHVGIIAKQNDMLTLRKYDGTVLITPGRILS